LVKTFCENILFTGFYRLNMLIENLERLNTILLECGFTERMVYYPMKSKHKIILLDNVD